MTRKSISVAATILCVSLVCDLCFGYRNNSRWFASNRASKQAQIDCQAPEHVQVVFDLEPHSKVDHVWQLDRSWGDGGGYPEPGITYSCVLSIGSRQAKFQFTSLQWGDSVRFEVDDSGVQVEQKCSFFDCKKESYVKIQK